ncbi:MAG: alpha/beta hydrolase [Deltaproteobacteria bacterium]|nr:alpha/beta hydrolase [Deltaproteobacteria bacterium]
MRRWKNLFGPALLAAWLAPACKTPRSATDTPVDEPQPATDTPVDEPQPAAETETGVVEEQVRWEAAGTTVHGTLTRPAGEGPFPAVLLIAGSGPTDRNWESPLLPGTNGTARLLAHALARRGVATLRYDKSGTGETAAPDGMTMATYLAEQQGGLALLRAHAAVDPARLFVAGHSEGALHALVLAHDAGGPLAGLVLLSGPGFSLADTMHRQISGQFAAAVAAGAMEQAAADAELEKLRGALDDVCAGRDVAPEHGSGIPGIAALVQSVAAPGQRALVAELLPLDPQALLAGLTLPLLVVNGAKDLQVRPDIDARALSAAATAAGLPDVELVVLEQADHVYKLEPRPFAELTPQDGLTYNADGRELDPALVETLAAWLARAAPAAP